jgi:tRNA/tmRNA/rRNA uracil-C5-methylase (TrmA/RlmC/RlmD family)
VSESNEDLLRSLVHITRLNWAGLGVASEPQALSEGSKGADRCVPLSRVGERFEEPHELRWRLDGRDRVVGERLNPPQGGWTSLGCEQALRCPGCTSRHLSPQEQAEALKGSHTAAIERLCPGALENLSAEPQVYTVSRDAYRARLYASLFWPPLSARDVFSERSSRRRKPLSSRLQALERSPDESHEGGEGWALREPRGGMWARWGEPIDLARCPVQTRGSRGLLNALLHEGERLGWGPPLEAFTIQAMSDAPEGLVLLHVKHSDEEEARALLRAHLISPELLHSCALYLSLSDPHAPKRAEPRVTYLAGLKRLTWSDGEGLTWHVTPPAWLPQTPSSVPRLRRLIWEVLSCEVGERIFELGCGVGVVSHWLSGRGVSVWGADLDEGAIEAGSAVERCVQAERELERSRDGAPKGLVHLEVSDGRRALARLASEGLCFDALLIHAMRSPLTGLLPLAAHLGLQRVCYVAPSAPSLARDLAEAPQYRLDRLDFLDQTPGSAHALCVARLRLEGD